VPAAIAGAGERPGRRPCFTDGGRQQLCERWAIGDLMDHRQLQRFHEVVPETRHTAQVLAGGCRVDEDQAPTSSDVLSAKASASCRHRRARRGSAADAHGAAARRAPSSVVEFRIRSPECQARPVEGGSCYGRLSAA